MSAPSTAITRLDLSMSYGEFNLAASRAGFIGLQALPPIGVRKEASDFSKISVEELLRPIEDTERKPKGTYKRDDFEWTTDSYDTSEHGVEEVVDDATIERYGDVIRAEVIHTQRAVHRVLAALENAIASALFTSSWSYKTAVGTAWTTPATATPIADIDGAIESVKTQLGMMPNTLILSDYALLKMKRTAEVEDLLKYSGRDDPKNLGLLSGLMELFDLERILVGNSFKNTADEGQSASFGRYWDATMAMVARIEDDGMDGDLESPNPQVGRTIFATGDPDNPAGGGVPLPGADGDGEAALIIEEYREESRRGGIVRARTKYQVKTLHSEAAHLLTGVTA